MVTDHDDHYEAPILNKHKYTVQVYKAQIHSPSLYSTNPNLLHKAFTFRHPSKVSDSLAPSLHCHVLHFNTW